MIESSQKKDIKEEMSIEKGISGRRLEGIFGGEKMEGIFGGGQEGAFIERKKSQKIPEKNLGIELTNDIPDIYS
jgi:hypothetical protein